MASSARVLEGPEPTAIPVLSLPLKCVVPAGQNRRFIPRVASTFVVRPLDGGPTFEGIDLSFGGLMCTGDEPVWPGNVIDMDLLLPNEVQPLPVRGRVVELVSCRGRVAMRLRFEDLTSPRRKRIALWMARQLGA